MANTQAALDNVSNQLAGVGKQNFPDAASRRPALIAALPPGAGTTTASALSAAGLAASDIANLTGFPDLIVPAGFTGDSLPVGLSFLGRAFSEPKLLSLGYSFEQATKARRRPVHTPALTGDTISVP